jgi:hypothetical protein
MLFYPYIMLNGWMASSVYHARKLPSTTLFDYVSAFALLLYSLVIALRRLMGPEANKTMVSILLLLFTVFAVLQSGRLLLGYVSYDEHMAVCMALAALQSAVWLIWLLVEGRSKDTSTLAVKRYKWLCLLCQMWLGGASLLEIFDFAPILGHFDAHSLWHLATIPLGFIWYIFWISDFESTSITDRKID